MASVHPNDKEYIIVLRHGDGGICLRDDGDDLPALREKATTEWAKAKKRLGEKKAGAMTLTVYRRLP